MTVAAVVALGASGLPPWLKVLGGAAAGICGVVAGVRLLRVPVRRCAWHAGGEWRVRDADGIEHPASLRHATMRGPLIALVLSAGPLRDIALVLLPDNCDADTRRRLRVRLSRSRDAPGADH